MVRLARCAVESAAVNCCSDGLGRVRATAAAPVGHRLPRIRLRPGGGGGVPRTPGSVPTRGGCAPFSLHSNSGLRGAFCTGAQGARRSKTAVSGPGSGAAVRALRRLRLRRPRRCPGLRRSNATAHDDKAFGDVFVSGKKKCAYGRSCARVRNFNQDMPYFCYPMQSYRHHLPGA